jgi:hypothetical protein
LTEQSKWINWRNPQTEFRFMKVNNNNTGGQLLLVLRLYITVALQQKTANFNVAVASRQMQWSALTEESKWINRRNPQTDSLHKKQ